MRITVMLVTSILFGMTAAPTLQSDAREPRLRLNVGGPAESVAVGGDIQLEVILSTDGDQAQEFLLGSFPQAFGIFVLGPWGPVQPDPSKIRPENWMHQEHSVAARIRISKGKPYRRAVKLSEYFNVADATQFKPGEYQVNVKFYESDWKMPEPIDSGPLRFRLAPKK